MPTPVGLIEAVKETAATLKTVLGAAEGDRRGELVDAIARDVADDARERKSPLTGFKPSKSATAGVEILDELGEVTASSRRRRRPRMPQLCANGCWPLRERRRTLPRKEAFSASALSV